MSLFLFLIEKGRADAESIATDTKQLTQQPGTACMDSAISAHRIILYKFGIRAVSVILRAVVLRTVYYKRVYCTVHVKLAI